MEVQDNDLSLNTSTGDIGRSPIPTVDLELFIGMPETRCLVV